MRMAVSAQGDSLESELDPRFGRASRFLIVDTDTMSFEVVQNDQNLNLPQGTGIQAAQNVAKYTPEILLTGNCGPKAVAHFILRCKRLGLLGASIYHKD